MTVSLIHLFILYFPSIWLKELVIGPTGCWVDVECKMWYIHRKSRFDIVVFMLCIDIPVYLL